MFVVYSFGGITENSPLICHPERLRRIYNILIINTLRMAVAAKFVFIGVIEAGLLALAATVPLLF